MRYSTASFFINFFIRTVNQALISSTGVLQGGSTSCFTFDDQEFVQPSLLPHREHTISQPQPEWCSHKLTHTKFITYNEHHNIVHYKDLHSCFLYRIHFWSQSWWQLYFSHTSLTTYQTKLCHKPESQYNSIHRRSSLKSHTIINEI